ITTSVPALQLGVESIDVINFRRPAGLAQFVQDEIAFRIHVRSDMMGDLSGGVTQPNPLVEGCRPEPHFASFTKLIPTPEPDMMPLTRAVADWSLEGQVLLPAEKKKVAHRRVIIWAAKHRVRGNSQAA